MSYLLDSDTVVDYLFSQPAVRSLLAQLAPEGLAISIVTYLELYHGVYTSKDPKQAERGLRAFLTTVTTLPLTRRVALRTARIRADLQQRGLPFKHRAIDLMVAATASNFDLTLLTSNTRDYQDIPNLKRRDPRAG